MHDVTALRTEGIEDLLHRHPDVRAKVDSGYQGMARDFPNQVSALPKKPGKDASADEIGAWETERKAQSSARICVEHAIAEPKKLRPLQRRIGRREHLAPRPGRPALILGREDGIVVVPGLRGFAGRDVGLPRSAISGGGFGTVALGRHRKDGQPRARGWPATSPRRAPGGGGESRRPPEPAPAGQVRPAGRDYRRPAAGLL